MIAVLGAGGQLGMAVCEALAARGMALKAFARSELDVTSDRSVRETLKPEAFRAVINCSAYNAVDAAESEPERANAVNALAPLRLAETGIPLIHISTDYVFDGIQSRPYEVSDPANPLSAYGRSKRAGELALLGCGSAGLIIRTAWLYSVRPGTRSFVSTMRKLLAERKEIRVVADQTGSPTYAEDLAEAIADLCAKKAFMQPMQILHYANAGEASRYAFACAIRDALGLSCRIVPVSSEDFAAAARRPHYSVLSLRSLEPWDIHPRAWQSALAEALQALPR